MISSFSIAIQHQPLIIKPGWTAPTANLASQSKSDDWVEEFKSLPDYVPGLRNMNVRVGSDHQNTDKYSTHTKLVCCRQKELVSLLNQQGYSYTDSPALPGAICCPPFNPGACRWWLASHSITLSLSLSTIIYFWLIMLILVFKYGLFCSLTHNSSVWIFDAYKSCSPPVFVCLSPSLFHYIF